MQNKIFDLIQKEPLHQYLAWESLKNVCKV